MIWSNNPNTFTIKVHRFLYILKYLNKASKYSKITGHYKELIYLLRKMSKHGLHKCRYICCVYLKSIKIIQCNKIILGKKN